MTPGAKTDHASVHLKNIFRQEKNIISIRQVKNEIGPSMFIVASSLCVCAFNMF
jgi:hypothetical protein